MLHALGVFMQWCFSRNLVLPCLTCSVIDMHLQVTCVSLKCFTICVYRHDLWFVEILILSDLLRGWVGRERLCLERVGCERRGKRKR